MSQTLAQRLAQPRPLIMGILNVTPDSFSDGGKFNNVAAALTQAQRMAAEGADIIDVGGESTRPGSARVAASEQTARTGEIIRAIRQTLPQVLISIDTTLPAVAEAALLAGAQIINDVQGGETGDMLALAARQHVPIVLMHMQGAPGTMQENPQYEDVAREVRDYLDARARAAENAGVDKTNIIIDPGIGFGKTKAHNLTLLQNLADLVASGYTVLLGTSRKRFLGSICEETTPSELTGATCATTALGVAAGVRIFRVHDVKPNRQAADVAHAILNNC